MQNDLDSMLRALKDIPPDHALDGLAGDVGRRLAAERSAGAQTWGLRAAAAGLVAMTGAVISASSTAAAAPEHSPFAVWSELAPSTLLGGQQ